MNAYRVTFTWGGRQRTATVSASSPSAVPQALIRHLAREYGRAIGVNEIYVDNIEEVTP